MKYLLFWVIFYTFLLTFQKIFPLTSLYLIGWNFNILCIFVTHISLLWMENIIMATLDERHFLSTCKVKTCPSHNFLNMIYEKKNPIKTTTYSPIVIIPKITLFINNSLNQYWIKTFLTIIWFWIYFRCNNWNMIKIYDT